MTWHDPAGARHDVVTIPVIWLAILLSLLVHVTALWLAWPHLRRIALDQANAGPSAPIAVQLASREANAPASAAATPPAAPAVAPSVPVPRRPPRVPVPRPPVARPPAAPPIMTRPEPQAPSRPPERPVEPAPALPPTRPAEPQPPTARPMEPDLASYIESRRRARGESPASSAASPGSPNGESEADRRNRIIAANLGLDRKPSFGYDPNSAGGIFQIKRVGYDDAEFYFLGLDRDIDRHARQLIEVRRGDAGDIRVAIVRKMIAIIRENVDGDFLWSSTRLGRQVHMSARPEDNAGLEDFIMRDVFPEVRR